MAQIAIQTGDAAQLAYLIHQRADPGAADENGFTLLMDIAGKSYANKAQVASVLIAGNANIDAADDIGRTALFFAARSGDIALVTVLSGSADKDAHDHYRVSALQWAVWEDNVPMVQLLLSMGADPYFHDSMGGSTPYDSAKNSPDPAMRALFGLP